MIFRPSFFCVSIVPVVNINLQAPLRFAKVSAEVAPKIMWQNEKMIRMNKKKIIECKILSSAVTGSTTDINVVEM